MINELKITTYTDILHFNFEKQELINKHNLYISLIKTINYQSSYILRNFFYKIFINK